MEIDKGESAIRALVARYCDAVNRYDARGWGDTWAPDGQWLFLQQVHEGRASIVEFWTSVMEQLDFAVMLANSALIHVECERATGRWYTQEIVRTKGEQGRSIVGVYDDHYRRVEGQWLIQSRRYHKLYEAPTDSREVHYPYPNHTD
jgi:uncharacterized protein (TIGR02246 family)